MTKWKCYLVASLLSLCFIRSYSQDNVSALEVDLQEKTPKSPNAGGLGRYFDIPVNMATGVPDISIPLYSIKSGNIVVPVVLSYHASGVKVDDIAGWCGLNWSINAGGSVTKKTNGLDDFYATTGIGSGTPNQDYMNPDYGIIDYNPGYTNMTEAVEGLMAATDPSAIDSINRFFTRILLSHLDGEADEFFYSMPGGSGKFYYNQVQQGLQTSKINGAIITGDVDGWTITTKDGMIYQFEVTERTKNPSYIKLLSSQQYLISSWHLNSITDPATGKQVNFTYDNYFKEEVLMGSYRTKDYDFTSGPPQYFNADLSDNIRTGDNYVLGTISFDQGVIYFVKDTTTRLDDAPNALKEIHIYNNRNLLLKKFVFDYFYATADSTAGECCSATFGKRLFLSSLQEIDYDATGNTLLAKPPYKFTYDTSIHLPQRLSFAQDKWGYYNGKTTNATSIPSHPAYGTYPVLEAANRNVDSNYTKAGMLNGIVYPTGGKTVFEFENNRDASDSLTGGLRIKRITHFDSVAQNSIVTEYRYVKPGESSSGEVWSNPVYNYDLLHTTGDVINGFTFKYILRTESSSINPLFPNQGAPVFYSVVEKREKGIDGDLLSRHYFKRFIESGDTYDNLISVPHPKELEVNDLLEYKTEIYKRNTDDSYELIKKDSSAFNTLQHTQGAIWNAQGAWTWTGSDFSEWPGGDPLTLTPMDTWFPPSIHAYKVMPGINVRTTQYTSTISDATTLTIPSFYEYDSTNGNLKVAKSVDSYGDTTIRIIKYVCDYISASSPSINYEIKSLLDHNMKASPVEVLTLLKKKDSTNSIVQSAVLYEYEELKVKKIYRVYDRVPFNSFLVSYNDVNGFYKDSHYQLQQEVTAWDGEGRPRTVITNTNTSSYIWDEKYRQPTAVVGNASYEDIAYTSFEGQSDGGWTVSSADRDSSYFITGRRCYQLDNGSISKSGLNNGTTYILSYWSRNGTGSNYTVSGTSTVTEGRTTNGWTYYEHVVNGVTSVTVSGANYIDELRLYPKAAQMTSFCYEELLGMITLCNVANHISYYEYYGPGKLKYVRDQDRNIIKKVCYNYAGQPEACNTYFNVQKSDDFTRNNCSQGYAGTTVTYTVPAGTYAASTQGAADTLALDDVNNNGQTYANAQGSCLLLYYNVEKSGNFTRNNCDAGYTGSTETYTVPASTYSSTISQAYVDSVAQADVDANGQAYANANGTCTQTLVTVTYNNSSSESFTATFTNTSTSQQYNLTINASTSSGTAGQIPPGTYNVSIVPYNQGFDLYNFNICTHYDYGVNSTTAYNLNVSGCAQINISDYF